MANEKYFPFKSVAGDRKYSAEDWAAYFSQFLSNGVFYNNDDSLKVIANEGMKVKVRTGAGFIEGRLYILKTDKILTLDIADGVLSRIDRVVLRCDYAHRKMSTEVIKGNYSENPTAPALTRNADTYELALADVYVSAGVIEITSNAITDQRLNDEFCGISTGVGGQLADLKAAAFANIANNLTTTASGSVLDARQGKVLNDAINTKAIKGSVAYSEMDNVTEPGIYRVTGTPSLMMHMQWDTNFACQIRNPYGGVMVYRTKVSGTWSAWRTIFDNTVITSTELSYLSGATSNIQTQINKMINGLSIVYGAKLLKCINTNFAPTYGANGLEYFNASSDTTSGAGVVAVPVAGKWMHILRMNHQNPTGYYTELALPLNDGTGIYFRVIAGGNEIIPWTKLMDQYGGNITGSLKASANLVAGNAVKADVINTDDATVLKIFGGADNQNTHVDVNGGTDTVTLYTNGTNIVAGYRRFYPSQEIELGTSSNHWACLYATNGTIQTSDRNKKTDIAELDADLVKAFILGLKSCAYKMINGTSGRTHYGLISQDVEKLLEELGISDLDFAGFIKSPKVEMVEVKNEEGEVVGTEEKVVEGEYEYALRYDEFISPLIKMVQMQQAEIDGLKAENEEMKAKMNSFEERFNRLEELQ